MAIRGNQFRFGDHVMICDRTGFKIKASESRKEWNGLRVRKQSWEPRHPQDKIRSVRDDQSVYDPRSEQPDRFIGVNQVQPSDL